VLIMNLAARSVSNDEPARRTITKCALPLMTLLGGRTPQIRTLFKTSTGSSSTGPEAHSRPGAGDTCPVLPAYHTAVALRIASMDPTVIIPCYPSGFMRPLSLLAAGFTADADVIRSTEIAVRIVWSYCRSIFRNPAAEATRRCVVEGKRGRDFGEWDHCGDDQLRTWK
jgi:hypothetical protein